MLDKQAATSLYSEAVFRSDTLSDRFSHCYGRVDECTFAVVWEELKISWKVGD